MSAFSKLSKLGLVLASPSRWLRTIKTLTAPATEHLKLLRALSPDTVIDVGANKGQFSLAARRALPVATIIAFEPLPTQASKYVINFSGDHRATLHPVALSDNSGTAVFHITNRTDSSSLLAPGPQQLAAYNVGEVSSIDVQCHRLDEFLRPDDLAGVVLLKLDVQGAEDRVIKGSVNILPFIQYVMLEASFVELYCGQPTVNSIISLMNTLQFSLRAVHNISVTRLFGQTQADLLFVNDSIINAAPA